MLQDPEYPYFRILDHWQREGGDNPDQLYAFSPITGGEPYRIWGTLGSASRAEIQLYSGDPWARAGRSAGYLEFERLQVAEDGSFVVELSDREPEAGAWLRNPTDATSVFVRHIYDRWDDDTPGRVHIDRVLKEGVRRLPESSVDVARRFRDAAKVLERATTWWPDFVHARYVNARPANTVSELIDTYRFGGVRGRWMAGGHFDLLPGQVLVIVTMPTDALYQAIQLTDMWFASLEYANLVSSLTSRQSVLSPDGMFYSVVGPEDPGHANWLDTGGHTRGVFLLRYDGVNAEIPAALHPQVRPVDVGDLGSLIPGFAEVAHLDRERVRASRRRHLQIRTSR